MLKLHPSIIKKNGKKEFVVLPYEEYERLNELLEDAYDIQMLRKARKADAGKPSISLAEAKKRLGLG